MKIRELGLKYPMDIGAPPKILASEGMLSLFYFVEQSPRGLSSDLTRRDTINDRGIGILKFDNYINFKFGYPNDEAIQGYPYYKLGLKPYSLFELNDSDWVANLLKIDSFNPMHRNDIFDDFSHYILSFHDSTFECIAKGYTAEYSDKSMAELLSENIQELIESE